MASKFLQGKVNSLRKRKSKPSQNLDKVNDEGELVIEAEADTHRPSEAWERLKEFNVARPLPTDTFLNRPRDSNSLRFVCMSDTHGAVEHPRREFAARVPDGDVLIHCGDFTMGGQPNEIQMFDSFIARLPHPVKLVIAGNHELTFEPELFGTHPELLRRQLGLPMEAPDTELVAGCKALLQNMLYLEEESVDICGIKIFGSPWVPQFGTCAFSARRGEDLLEKWNKIPSDTDILITHGPPCGFGDTVFGGDRAGCVELLNTVVRRVKPKFHAFGHIHTGYGMWTNGTTTFLNAAICSHKYKPDHDPIVFDVPLPKGYTREDFAQLSTQSLREAKAKAAESGHQTNGVCESGQHSGDSAVSGHWENTSQQMNGDCRGAESVGDSPESEIPGKRMVESLKSNVLAQLKSLNL